MPLAGVSSLNYASVDNAAATGDTTIIPAVAGKRIVVLGYTLVAAGAVAIRWKSGANNISGAMPLAANGGLVVNGGPDLTVLQTNPGEALVLNAGGAVQVSGHVTYITPRGAVN